MIGLGSMSQLGIGISVRLHDQFSAQAAKINAQLKAMNKISHGALTGAIRDYRNQSMAIAGGAALVTAGMIQVTKVAADYDHVINQIAIIGGKGLGKTRKELDAMAQSLSKLFPGYGPKDIGTAMLENVRAGVAGGLDEITKYQLAVAQATGEAVGGEQGVGAGLLGMLNAMNMPLKDFPRVANAVSQAANISMASVFSLNESMQYFANNASLAGITLEETLALVARLSQVNIRGSIAGTSLSNMVRHATSSVGMFQSPKNKKAWAAMGISSDQVVDLINKGQWFDLIDVVDKATKGMERQKKASLIDQIFGVRGEKALVNMFGNSDPNKTLRALKEAISQGVTEGVSMKQAAAMTQDPWADFKRVGNQLAILGIKFLHAAEPTLRVLLGIATKVISVVGAILDTGVGKVLAGIAVVGAPIVGILFAFRAATLTATLALNTLARSAAVGGYTSLMGGGMGMIGGSRLGSAAGNVAKNAAGRWMVKGGQTMTLGGKLYKGGQLLPGNWMKLAGIGGAGAAAGGLASKAAGFFGKAGPWLGRLGGFALKWLPVIGWIYTGVEVLKGIFDIQKGLAGEDGRQKLDPVFMSYYKNLDQQLSGYSKQPDWYNQHDMSNSQYREQLKKMSQPGFFTQNLNISLDGSKVFNDQIKQTIDQSIERNLNFELPGN